MEGSVIPARAVLLLATARCGDLHGGSALLSLGGRILESRRGPSWRALVDVVCSWQRRSGAPGGVFFERREVGSGHVVAMLICNGSSEASRPGAVALLGSSGW